jgi:hypothetical protein
LGQCDGCSHAPRVGLENLALRQQLAVGKARQPRPRLTALDRIFWVVLSRLWKSWRSSLQVVRPETVVGWHRQGFRRYWAWKSRRRRGRSAIGTELRDLIRRTSCANPLWGAPRIHGELLKLGLTVSQATVSKLSFAKTSSDSVDDSRCSRDRPRNPRRVLDRGGQARQSAVGSGRLTTGKARGA